MAGEFVLKLRGSIQERGLLNELVGAKLAAHFELSSPVPALIVLEPTLAELIANAYPLKAEIVRRSVGLNFGTQVLIGFSTWPVDKQVPDVMREAATNIFAFDALLQNPDRRHGNPNLLTKGDTMMVFDHEVAFSFLLDLFPSQTPWNMSNQRYMTDHVFYHQLKSQPIDLTTFTYKLDELSTEVLEEVFADVPAEWKNENGPRIVQHLSAVRDHAQEFAEQIRRFLV